MNARNSTMTSVSRAALAAGCLALLAGCDFASRLPDAPTTTLTLPEKPPSVTAGGAGPDPIFLPDPPVDPVQSTGLAVEGIAGLDEPPTDVAVLEPNYAAPAERLLREQPFDAGPFQPGDIGREGEIAARVAEAPRALITPPKPQVELQTERLTLTPPEPLPPLDKTVPAELPAPIYDPVGSSGVALNEPPVGRFEQQIPEPRFAVAEPRSNAPIYAELEKPAARQTATTLGTASRAADAVTSGGLSPIALLHTRMPNGSVITIHPVIRAPGPTSVALVTALGQELGRRVGGDEAERATARFHLRGIASTSPSAGVTWRLLDSNGSEVRVIDERSGASGWNDLAQSDLRALSASAAGALRNDAALRQATINTVAKTPRIAPNYAPIPRARRAATQLQAAQPMARSVRMAPIVDRPQPRRSDQVDVAALSAPPSELRLVSQPPRQVTAPRMNDQMLEIAPLVEVIAPRQQQTATVQEPVRAAPAPVPVTVASALPTPSFETLRPAEPEPVRSAPQPVQGPPTLVFRGVNGAPGDGDTTLSREISRMLAQSGAPLGRDGTPGALYLSGSVSKQSRGQADEIRIVWRVQNGLGESVGEVVQENAVPAGSLDQSWGQDASYAAQGARDGIIQLLQAAGALET